MPDGQRIKQIEESGYTYLGIIPGSEIKNQVMKDTIRTNYLRRVRESEKLKLYPRNVFMRINQWVLAVVRYSEGIADWTRGDLELLDRETRKILTCNDFFHSRTNVARLYVKRCKGGIPIISAKYCSISECNGL